MRSLSALIIAASVLGSSGCMNDRTKAMASTCQDLLDSNDQTNVTRFVREAEEQIASLDGRQHRISLALRNLQDRDAMAYVPALKGCLEQLKSRKP